MFLNRWPVDQCAYIFDRLTKRFFGNTRRHTHILARLRRAVQCWLSDSCYEADVLESALQDIFSSYRRMFDFDPIKSSTRVAVTATVITDAHSVILSNYNGDSRTEEDCGKCAKRWNPRIIDVERRLRTQSIRVFPR